MSPGLLDMPEVAMTKIMEDSGIKAIMTLRKVCHDLRNFINNVQPDAKLEEISLYEWDSSAIVVRYHFPGGFYDFKYLKHEEGCLVKTNKKAFGMKLLKNEDFLAVCMKDFDIVLGHQKSVLKQFAITADPQKNVDIRVMEDLLRILKLRNHPLKVGCFAAGFMDQNQILSILPYLNSGTLNTLDVAFNEEQTEIDQLIESDQWKNIKQVVFKTPIDLKFIQHFTHFSTASVAFKSENFPDLVSLKSFFLQWPGFETISIGPNFTNINDIQRSIEPLGQPILDLDMDEEIKHAWYYCIPNTNQVLEINVYDHDFIWNGMNIELSRIEGNSVPQGAVIQN